ncbi:flagellar hook capping protein [Pseudomonas sp. Z1-14]|uniref:Basal-body rod modification protein FlgD n=1 Tax=Pseudomonas brassicacearum (strain NFM421) TaxID=994484 RepID=F2KFN5_PSEBN|nr:MULTISPECIES: flagellar hook capping FlgD N-terminal domain-containing protein [Pseudomonas]AEA68701.1 Putative flagellar hook capping protein [Pseudomonas brassicacearum subsp. brassicacearum NFM421]AOS37970.1 flagellar hook capping protein [Pseudomonas brassicacearum]MDR8386123.1 flagellar hook capping protein [Pseudomonas sp. JL2]PJH88166.1 flagellar hook capping protein [Pseudomonas sp. WCS365]ROM98285.1 flagellar hook capping protein [Pseudomonas brassicacearum]
MAVEAIGNELSSTTSELAQSRLGQEDFIKLFLTELTFQDPLEPINNREFLAQMAQFANLEQTRITNENTDNLVSMNATSQSLGLLGRQVEVSITTGGTAIGSVTAIAFSSTGPVLSVKRTDGTVLTDVRLSQIKLVRQGA